MRSDLLALGEDELAQLSNRGTVRRAAKEAGSVAVAEAADGTVVATGADGVVATLPPGVPIEDARCECPAVGLCRHVVRAVLAYRASPPDAPEPEGASDDAPAAPVDPLAVLPARVRAAGERLLGAGVTATVLRSTKPVVLLHETGTTVRFLVPGDLGYARCDCRDAPPCAHVVPAVRALAADRPVVEFGRREPDTAALRGLDRALALLAEAGAAAGQSAVRAGLDTAATVCRAGGLGWPADVLAELADLCGRHAVADSGFDPLRLAQLTGEAVLRADTLRHPGSPVPAVFAGGLPGATETEVGSGRLIGLGTRVRQAGRVVEVDALTYDTTARRVVALGRTVLDPAPEDGPPRSYADLAAGGLQKGITIVAAGAGQLVLTGARRTPAGRLRLGRRPAALGAQRFDWAGTLGPPVLVEGAAEAAGVAPATFPAPLSPRTVGTGVVVVPVEAVADVGFDPVAQAVTATLTSPDGGTVALVHPFASRAAGGSQALLHGLTAGTVRFVAGEVGARGSVTVVRPCGVVVEDSAGARRLVAPWTDPAPSHQDDHLSGNRSRTGAAPAPRTAITAADHLLALQLEVGSLLTTGVARADRTVRAGWSRLAEQLDALGSTVLAPGVERVAAALHARADDPGWVPDAAVAALLELAAAVELARAL